MSGHRQQAGPVTTEFNVGIDVEEIERFAFGPEDVGMRGLFTPEEREYCAGFVDAPARYAGTWCAKEAAIKALWPWARLDTRRVAVARANDGRPHLLISGLDDAAERVSIRVSISHTSSVASACVIAWGPRVVAPGRGARGSSRG
jgi:phosphopantetheine--protein transferase-like protein